ncbi:hypothetical protein E2542_SST12597 [Spatholobus suberectus]|nr:hypothetical protein E2542_SST12597 [Spatholobus suberectus]
MSVILGGNWWFRGLGASSGCLGLVARLDGIWRVTDWEVYVLVFIVVGVAKAANLVPVSAGGTSQISNAVIRLKIKWATHIVNIDGRGALVPQGYLWACMDDYLEWFHHVLNPYIIRQEKEILREAICQYLCNILEATKKSLLQAVFMIVG